jgi:hypothetical protein
MVRGKCRALGYGDLSDEEGACDGSQWTEHIGGPALKLGLPRRDLIGMHVELVRQLSQCSIALDGGKRHLRLESRCVVPACSSAHRLS